eukprot:5476683-Lingulodinium_polyedra.AAC.1
MLQKRIANGIDPILLGMQYGFRKHRGTTDALHVVKRTLEYLQSGRANCALVFLRLGTVLTVYIHEEQRSKQE